MKNFKLFLSYLFATEKNLLLRTNREIKCKNEIRIVGRVLNIRYWSQESLEKACEKFLV